MEGPACADTGARTPIGASRITLKAMVTFILLNCLKAKCFLDFVTSLLVPLILLQFLVFLALMTKLSNPLGFVKDPLFQPEQYNIFCGYEENPSIYLLTQANLY